MDWILDFVAPDEFPEIAAATGAMLIGRRTYEVANRMDVGKERGSVSSGEGYPFSGPVFVLTHELPGPPDPEVTFLTGDIGEAVATARSAAGGKNLEILGADVAGQCLRRGSSTRSWCMYCRCCSVTPPLSQCGLRDARRAHSTQREPRAPRPGPLVANRPARLEHRDQGRHRRACSCSAGAGVLAAWHRERHRVPAPISGPPHPDR